MANVTIAVKGIQQLWDRLTSSKKYPVLHAGLCAVLFATLALVYLFVQFRGFSSATAMDQAQIARQIAEGKGFSTKYIRPFAIWQLEQAGKEVPAENFPEIFQSPLNPFLNALPLGMVRNHWKLTPIDLVYIGDRMIAAMAILFFLVAMVFWYLVGRSLFNESIALIGCVAILVTDLLWQFSLSGLPQMLMLMLFSAAVWLTLQAMKKNGERLPMAARLFGAGVLFGLMALAHGAAIGIFFGWFFFVFFYFQPRGIACLSALAAVVLLVSPWLVRNHSVSGNMLGIAGYEMLAPVGSGESGYLRSFSGAPALSGMQLFHRLRLATITHAENGFSFLGMNIAAAAFFLSFLHRFSAQTTSRFRWGVLLMWAGAWLGMALCGVEGVVSANQLHVLLIPLFVFYGVAFLLELWARLELRSPYLRASFPALICILCGMPMLSTLLSPPPPLCSGPLTCHRLLPSSENGMAKKKSSPPTCHGLSHGMHSATAFSCPRRSRISTKSATIGFWASPSTVFT